MLAPSSASAAPGRAPLRCLRNLRGASAHAELHLFTTRLERDEGLFLPQDLDFNPLVEAQAEGVQGRGGAARAAPGPLPRPGTILLRAPTGGAVHVQPATERQREASTFMQSRVAEGSPYVSVAMVTRGPAVRVEYGSG